jgi:hypothetical protein
MAAVTGTFTATGQSATFTPDVATRDTNCGQVNISTRGTFDATVQIERSFDNGVNFFICSEDAAGTNAAYTAPFSVTAQESEAGTLYRLNCTAYTSGTITYRIGK